MGWDTLNISSPGLKSGEEMLFYVQIQIHQEMTSRGAAQRPVCSGGLSWESSLPSLRLS